MQVNLLHMKGKNDTVAFSAVSVASGDLMKLNWVS